MGCKTDVSQNGIVTKIYIYMLLFFGPELFVKNCANTVARNESGVLIFLRQHQGYIKYVGHEMFAELRDLHSHQSQASIKIYYCPCSCK